MNMLMFGAGPGGTNKGSRDRLWLRCRRSETLRGSKLRVLAAARRLLLLAPGMWQAFGKGNGFAAPNGEPQEYRRNMIGVYTPGSSWIRVYACGMPTRWFLFGPLLAPLSWVELEPTSIRNCIACCCILGQSFTVTATTMHCRRRF